MAQKNSENAYFSLNFTLNFGPFVKYMYIKKP